MKRWLARPQIERLDYVTHDCHVQIHRHGLARGLLVFHVKRHVVRRLLQLNLTLPESFEEAIRPSHEAGGDVRSGASVIHGSLTSQRARQLDRPRLRPRTRTDRHGDRLRHRSRLEAGATSTAFEPLCGLGTGTSRDVTGRIDAFFNYSTATKRLAARRHESTQGVQRSCILHPRCSLVGWRP